MAKGFPPAGAMVRCLELSHGGCRATGERRSASGLSEPLSTRRWSVGTPGTQTGLDPNRRDNAIRGNGRAQVIPPAFQARSKATIAALFTDLIDSADEGDDRTNYPAHYVSEVLRTCRVDGSKRNDVSDFVWCLENRVSDVVHNSNFPGIDAPDNATEGASEPSDWDADDIRRTWIQSVGY